MTREERVDEMSQNLSVEDLEDLRSVFYQGVRNFISRKLCDKGNPLSVEIMLDDEAQGLSSNDIPTVVEISEVEDIIHITFAGMEHPFEVDDLSPNELLEIVRSIN